MEPGAARRGCGRDMLARRETCWQGGRHVGKAAAEWLARQRARELLQCLPHHPSLPTHPPPPPTHQSDTHTHTHTHTHAHMHARARVCVHLRAHVETEIETETERKRKRTRRGRGRGRTDRMVEWGWTWVEEESRHIRRRHCLPYSMLSPGVGVGVGVGGSGGSGKRSGSRGVGNRRKEVGVLYGVTQRLIGACHVTAGDSFLGSRHHLTRRR
jgi:hypothetical protein